MRGCPVRNLICVIALLLAMAAGIAMTTRRNDGVQTTQESIREITNKTVNVSVRMLFSHPPKRVSIPGYIVEALPIDNELDITLDLPAEEVTELPLDIQWKECEDAHYFTQITIRRDGIQDDVVIFTDQSAEFADMFRIDTRTKKP